MKKLDFKNQKLVLIIGLIVIVIVGLVAFFGYQRYQSVRTIKTACQKDIAQTETCTTDSLFVGCNSFF